MKIMKPMKLDRIAYRCECKICGTKVEVEKGDLHYAGKLDLYWICPICCFEQREPILKLTGKKVITYVEVEKE